MHPNVIFTLLSILSISACGQEPNVQVYVIKNGGHTWPGKRPYLTEKLIGKTSQDFDATDAIWKFFQSCPPRVLKIIPNSEGNP